MSHNPTTSHNVRSKKVGILLVASLVVATLVGHLVTRQSDAMPTIASSPGLESSDSLVSLTGKLDRNAVLQGGDGHVRMELSLSATEVEGAAMRQPVDMIVVLDRSPSMASDGKIESARAAIHELVNGLRNDDRLALVAFAGSAEVLIPLTRAMPEARAAWHRLVDGIGLVSATNVSAGLDVALALAREVRRSSTVSGRMLLISDGEANQGDTTVEGLTGRALQASRLEFVLSSIGVGQQFNEFLMSAMADAGTGNYYYLSDTRQLAEVFANELGATRATVARAVAVTLEPAPGVEVVDAAGYPLERSGGAVTFRPGTLFSGQERRVWVTFQVRSAEPGERPLAKVRTTYVHDGRQRTLEFAETPRIACVDERGAWFAGIDKDAWERSVVEEDYGRLRQKVAGQVNRGRREEALKEIQLYEQKNRVMNQELASEQVRSNLEELKKLEAEVKDAFVGHDQLQKRKVLSKEQQARSWDGRRAGAKLKKKTPAGQQKQQK